MVRPRAFAVLRVARLRLSRWRRHPPERRRSPESLEGDWQVASEFGGPEEIVGRQPFSVAPKGKKRCCQLAQWSYSVFATRIELHPPSDMLFRPEEVHLASRVRPVLTPTPGRETDMRHDGRWGHQEHIAVLHAHVDRLSTVEARTVDAD